MRDPVTDELRATQEHPFASRPLGSIDEEGMPVREHNEFADAIRIANEILWRRARSAGTTALREAALLCLAFWHDCATSKVEVWKDARAAAWDIFGSPPRTNTVLSRMLDWQDWRITPKGQWCRLYRVFGRPAWKTEAAVQKPSRVWPHVNGLAQSEMRVALEEAWTGLVLGDPGERTSSKTGRLFMPAGAA